MQIVLMQGFALSKQWPGAKAAEERSTGVVFFLVFFFPLLSHLPVSTSGGLISETVQAPGKLCRDLSTTSSWAWNPTANQLSHFSICSAARGIIFCSTSETFVFKSKHKNQSAKANHPMLGTWLHCIHVWVLLWLPSVVTISESGNLSQQLQVKKNSKVMVFSPLTSSLCVWAGCRWMCSLFLGLSLCESWSLPHCWPVPVPALHVEQNERIAGREMVTCHVTRDQI